jgi:hypothetical protein
MAPVVCEPAVAEELVTGGQLTPDGDDPRSMLMVPLSSDREPTPHRATS